LEQQHINVMLALSFLPAKPLKSSLVLQVESGKNYLFVWVRDDTHGRWTSTMEYDFDFQFISFAASQCPPLPETPNVKQVVLSGGGRSYGTIVRFDCDSGYVRSGPPVLLCMSNGTWSEEAPTCSRKANWTIEPVFVIQMLRS
jgi:hypothetical protein